jgi:hypothetical protein
MAVLAAVLALAVLAIVLWDAFETILLPRRVPSRLRLSRIVLRGLWVLWATIARRIERSAARENFLGLYALLSLIGLFVVWAAGLIFGFAALYWAFGSKMMAHELTGFPMDLYLSGTTLFTLGIGDVTPDSAPERLIVVIEAGMGFGFLAMIIAYVPVLYQSFSRREARITMLDEWAGSPPSAAVILRRCFESRTPGVALDRLLQEWELTASEMLESHLSYPILAYFRSQHDNQSWLASLSAILDTCAVVIAGIEGVDPFQARLTFAIGRHLLVDVSQNLALRRPFESDEVHALENVAELKSWLAAGGVALDRGPEADQKLLEIRRGYVPYVRVLAELLLTPVPSLLPPPKVRYNWETTAWARTGRHDAH